MRTSTQRVAAMLAFGLALTSCTTGKESADPPSEVASAAPTPSSEATRSDGWPSLAIIESSGSAAWGVVLTTDGHVLVGNYVTETDDTPITVTFDNGETSSAVLMGMDPHTRLAAVKVDGPPELVPAGFAGTDLGIGDAVLMLQVPPADPGPAASGTIRATGISFGNLSVIETDAVAPGGSTGPLVNASGEIVGITIGSISASDGSGPGSSIAIPASLAARVADELIAGEPVAHPFLGISVDEAADGETVVVDVASDGPADQGGVRPGDVITTIGDRTVDAPFDVVSAIQHRRVGEDIVVGYLRDGAAQETIVTLGRRL